ncbi:MAG: hypothetical protein IKH27_01060 [Oscillospiraceae bacterium]|nr:hypothetical protein [Oscillospiraceae bacterium]
MIELRGTPEDIRDLKAYAESKGMSAQALLCKRADALYEKMQAELGADYQVRKPGHWF